MCSAQMPVVASSKPVIGQQSISSDVTSTVASGAGEDDKPAVLPLDNENDPHLAAARSLCNLILEDAAYDVFVNQSQEMRDLSRVPGFQETSV